MIGADNLVERPFEDRLGILEFALPALTGRAGSGPPRRPAADPEPLRQLVESEFTTPVGVDHVGHFAHERSLGSSLDSISTGSRPSTLLSNTIQRSNLGFSASNTCRLIVWPSSACWRRIRSGARCRPPWPRPLR